MTSVGYLNHLKKMQRPTTCSLQDICAGTQVTIVKMHSYAIAQYNQTVRFLPEDWINRCFSNTKDFSLYRTVNLFLFQSLKNCG